MCRQCPGMAEAQLPIALHRAVAGNNAVGLNEEEGKEHRAPRRLLEDPVQPESLRRREREEWQVRAGRVCVEFDVGQEGQGRVFEPCDGMLCCSPSGNVAVK